MGVISSVMLRVRASVVGVLPATRCFGLKRALARWAGIDVAAGVRMHSGVIFETGFVHVGENTWIGNRSHFIAAPDAPIRVGRDCSIAPACLLVTGSHEIGEPDCRAGRGFNAPIEIGDGCWLGARVTVLAGVTIGKGCVIAAGAVVAKDVPDNSLAGGVPARAIRMLAPGGPSSADAATAAT